MNEMKNHYWQLTGRAIECLKQSAFLKERAAGLRSVKGGERNGTDDVSSVIRELEWLAGQSEKHLFEIASVIWLRFGINILPYICSPVSNGGIPVDAKLFSEMLAYDPETGEFLSDEGL